jgi:hypothetical protein
MTTERPVDCFAKEGDPAHETVTFTPLALRQPDGSPRRPEKRPWSAVTAREAVDDPHTARSTSRPENGPAVFPDADTPWRRDAVTLVRLRRGCGGVTVPTVISVVADASTSR